MVERHIQEQSDFHPYNRTQALIGQVSDWAGSFVSGLAPSQQGLAGAHRWARENRVPLSISVLWVVALGAYAIGYVNRLHEQTGSGMLPALDLVFLAFSIVGPVAMVWVVSGLLHRTERLTDTIADQNETVLALATSVATLAANLDTVSANTAGRLDTACNRMEKDMRASTKKLDRSLEDIATKIDATLLDSVIHLDRATRDRTAHVEKLLENDRELLIKRLDTDAETLSNRIDAILGGIDEKIGSSLTGALDDQRDRVEAATAKIGQAMATLTAQVEETGQTHTKWLDESVRQNIATLGEAISTATEMLEAGLVQPVARISARLEETAASIAAHPPASAEELAVLLDEAATNMIREERALLAENVVRIGMLEEAAEKLLKQIDRTSRLNPYVEAPVETAPAAPAPAAPPALGLTLPEDQIRTALNWTALVEVLEARPILPGTRQTMQTVLADPDVATVVEAGRPVLDAFVQESVHVEDLPPEHISTELWHRFGLGERGGEIIELAGIEDDITLAIVRARLRRDPALRLNALRFAQSYIRLVGRAAQQIGNDPRLIEMADTPFGRAFLILASLFDLFRAAPVVHGD